MIWCLAPVFVRGSVQARALVGSLSINKHPNIFTLEPFTEKYADSRGADVCDVGGARLGEKRKDNIKKPMPPKYGVTPQHLTICSEAHSGIRLAFWDVWCMDACASGSDSAAAGDPGTTHSSSAVASHRSCDE